MSERKEKFLDLISVVDTWIVEVAVIVALFLWFLFFSCGGYASTEGYTIRRDYCSGDSPNPNVFFDVVEVRKMGEDRKVYTTFDIDDAIRVMKEIAANGQVR